MTVTPLPPRPDRQTLRERVAEEVRAELARQRISVNAASKSLGWSQPYLSRRVNGTVPFDVDDLETLSTWLRVPLEQLLGRPAPAVSEPASRRVSGR